MNIIYKETVDAVENFNSLMAKKGACAASSIGGHSHSGSHVHIAADKAVEAVGEEHKVYHSKNLVAVSVCATEIKN